MEALAAGFAACPAPKLWRLNQGFQFTILF
jgi:hypothetical protein